jgi:hypothetical protein
LKGPSRAYEGAIADRATARRAGSRDCGAWLGWKCNAYRTRSHQGCPLPCVTSLAHGTVKARARLGRNSGALARLSLECKVCRLGSLFWEVILTCTGPIVRYRAMRVLGMSLLRRSGPAMALGGLPCLRRVTNVTNLNPPRERGCCDRSVPQRQRCDATGHLPGWVSGCVAMHRGWHGTWNSLSDSCSKLMAHAAERVVVAVVGLAVLIGR